MNDKQRRMAHSGVQPGGTGRGRALPRHTLLMYRKYTALRVPCRITPASPVAKAGQTSTEPIHDSRNSYHRRKRGSGSLCAIACCFAASRTGLLVSMFQAATQINEVTLSFVPKLLVTLLTFIVAGPWLLERLVDYMRRLIESIPVLIG